MTISNRNKTLLRSVTWCAPPCLSNGQLFMEDLRFTTCRLGKSSWLPQSLHTKTRRREQREKNMLSLIKCCIFFKHVSSSLSTTYPVQGLSRWQEKYKLNKMLIYTDILILVHTAAVFLQNWALNHYNINSAVIGLF